MRDTAQKGSTIAVPEFHEYACLEAEVGQGLFVNTALPALVLPAGAFG